MNIKKIQAKHIAHGIMCVFAIASLFNIEDFVFTIHANKPLSWAVAVALSAALVIFAALLSEMKWGGRGFWIMLAVVAGLTIVSGAIQGASYAAHTKPIAGWLMGFSLPLFGELGASLALSVYVKEQQARSMDEAQKQLSDGVRKNIIDALGNVDKTLIERQVSKAVTTITRELIDASVNDMIAELRAGRVNVVPVVVENEALTALQLNAPTTPDLTPAALETPIVNGETPDFTQRMNDAKRKKAIERQNTLFDILRNEFNGVHSDELNRTALGERLGATRQTIGKDLEALIAANRISLNGHLEVL